MVANRVNSYVNVAEAEYAELPNSIDLEPAVAIDTRVIYTPPRKSKARIAFVRDYDWRTGWYFVEYWIIGARGYAIRTGGWVPLESIQEV